MKKIINSNKISARFEFRDSFSLIQIIWFGTTSILAIVCFILFYRSLNVNYFSENERFHPNISAESNFFPSVSEIVDSIKTDDPSKQFIHVIVGGSSGFYGVGQPVSQSLSYQLRSSLGSKFKVWNLAFRGGGPAGQGAVVAESLLKLGYKVIYVADAQPGGISPLNSVKQYEYFFWQAYFGDFLFKWSDRDEILSQSRQWHDSIVLQAYFDSILRFSRLFNYIAYNYVSFIPNPFANVFDKFKARNFFHDDERSPKLISEYTRGEGIKQEIEIWKATSSQVISDSDWSSIVNQWNSTILPELRAKSIFYVAMEASGVRNLTNVKYTKMRISTRLEFIKRLRSIGIDARLITDDWPENFWVDRAHWSSLGARRASKVLSEDIISKVKELGYIK